LGVAQALTPLIFFPKKIKNLKTGKNPGFWGVGIRFLCTFAADFRVNVY
jgi:hypothetical protein